MRGRTVLMIAHRLSTIIEADLICVMDKGQIAEMGNHSELMASGGIYARLNRAQFGIVLDENVSKAGKKAATSGARKSRKRRPVSVD
jgi:ABC-type multidrug transport system ATPase subunit